MRKVSPLRLVTTRPSPWEDDSSLFESGVHPTLPASGNAIFRLFRATSALLEKRSTEGRLLSCMLRARSLLEECSVEALFSDLFSSAEARAQVLDCVSELQHVGLLVPESMASELPRVAEMAGFEPAAQMYPSAVVARELGNLLGRPTVATSIFKATAMRGRRDAIQFEAFVPSADDEIVRSWIEQDVTSHVGVRVKGLTELMKLKAIFASEGYNVPYFMNGAPITNRFEQITVLYFDGYHDGRRVRVECFCNEIA